MHATLPLLIQTDFPALRRRAVETLQLNLGYRCNQSCLHCHVNAGPKRTEAMTAETIDAVLDFIAASPGIKTIDLTGGAPELNPEFRRLVVAARARGLRVIDRCNLTILDEPGFGGMADFLAGHRVEIVASLPCYLEENVDRQRGKGVFAASLRGLRQLNALGYGQAGSGLVLNLVYNPQGPSLPPPQAALQEAYSKHLGESYGIVFNELFTLANMPIQRFGSMLISQGRFNAYMHTLRAAHRDDNLAQVMCRSLISVDWQGWLYDCDFNQQLGLALADAGGGRLHITRAAGAGLDELPIRVAEHCYGCTAGQGSSCGGALGHDTAAAPSCGA
ncbi:MAG: arsenosugar biosynthesis radical SAM protein ArsS [Betaproteobacteria bacterium]|nr:arsenosugar biosynthesis radical SAM protein ArsS [Betaproteobacteria bacterium]